MTKSKSAGELIKHFASIVDKQDPIGIQANVLRSIQGPIHNAREKLRALKSSEAIEVMSSTGYDLSFKAQVEDQIHVIFDDEVQKAEETLKTAAVVIRKLDDCLEDINTRMFEARQADELIDGLVIECYEDCRTILSYLKLRNKLLKHALLVPADHPVTCTVFPEELNEEHAYIVYLLCKIQQAKFS